MTEVKKCLEGQSGEEILRKVKGQDDLVELDPDVTLYFYTSFPPCGDATISQKVSFTYKILCGVLDREGIELCTALFCVKSGWVKKMDYYSALLYWY